MTTDIEKQFFETFGIEPNSICKYAKYGYDGTEGTWYFCSKNQEECWTYPSDTTCKDKMASYPEITDRILLELICIVLNAYDKLEVYTEYTVEKVKEKTLKQLILAQDDVYSQVQALFEER